MQANFGGTFDNFSFEFFYDIFTEDAALRLLLQSYKFSSGIHFRTFDLKPHPEKTGEKKILLNTNRTFRRHGLPQQKGRNVLFVFINTETTLRFHGTTPSFTAKSFSRSSGAYLYLSVADPGRGARGARFPSKKKKKKEKGKKKHADLVHDELKRDPYEDTDAEVDRCFKRAN